MRMGNIGKDIESFKFERAMAELENIVKKLEAGDQSLALEESIELYKRGILLSEHCKNILEKAQQEINILTKGQGGELEEIPFTVDDDGTNGI